MASNAPVAGEGPYAFPEKKMDEAQNNAETCSTYIEPAHISYGPDHGENDGAVEINYHTLTWWYAHIQQSLAIIGPWI